MIWVVARAMVGLIFAIGLGIGALVLTTAALVDPGRRRQARAVRVEPVRAAVALVPRGLLPALPTPAPDSA